MTTQAISQASSSRSDSTVSSAPFPEAPVSTSNINNSPADHFIDNVNTLALKWTTRSRVHAGTTTTSGTAEAGSGTLSDQQSSPIRKRTELVVGLKKWTGVIQQVEEDLFTAELTPIDHEGPTLLADFDLALLAPDAATVTPGDVIYLTTRFVTGIRGYTTATTQIRLRRAGHWSENELAEIREAARRSADQFSQYVD